MWILWACTALPLDSASTPKSVELPESEEEIDPITLIDATRLPAAENPCREPVLVDVFRVIDGDTFYGNSSTREEKVRIIGINTPEVGWDGEPSECYAEEAKGYAEEKLYGKKVWLTFDTTCYDGYERTLAYVHLGPNEADFLQRSMLQEGYGWAYPFDDTPAFTDTFEQDEQLARQNNSGGWSSCGW